MCFAITSRVVLSNNLFLVSKRYDRYFPEFDLHRPIHSVSSSVMLVITTAAELLLIK